MPHTNEGEAQSIMVISIDKHSLWTKENYAFIRNILISDLKRYGSHEEGTENVHVNKGEMLLRAMPKTAIECMRINIPSNKFAMKVILLSDYVYAFKLKQFRYQYSLFSTYVIINKL
jgi:hypothetical protein